MKRVDKFVIALTLIALVGVMVTQSLTRAGSRDNRLAPYTTRSANPNGTKALYMLAEEAGLRPQRWGFTMLQLGRVQGVLVTFEPGFFLAGSRPAGVELDALDRWVAAGNVALVCEGVAPSALGLELVRVGTDTPESHGDVPAFGEVRSVFEAHEDDDEVLVSAGSGRVVLLRRAVGDGFYLALSDQDILTNERLSEEEHAAILSLLSYEDRPLLFDEYHLGYATPQSPLDALPGPVRTGVVVIGILCLLFVLKLGSRFGKVEEEPRLDTRRSGAELAKSLGALLRGKKSTRLALDQLTTRFRIKHGLSTGEDLAAALTRHTIQDADTRAALAGVTALERKPTVTTAELSRAALALVSAEDTISKSKRGITIDEHNKPV